MNVNLLQIVYLDTMWRCLGLFLKRRGCLWVADGGGVSAKAHGHGTKEGGKAAKETKEFAFKETKEKVSWTNQLFLFSQGCLRVLRVHPQERPGNVPIPHQPSPTPYPHPGLCHVEHFRWFLDPLVTLSDRRLGGLLLDSLFWHSCSKCSRKKNAKNTTHFQRTIKHLTLKRTTWIFGWEIITGLFSGNNVRLGFSAKIQFCPKLVQCNIYDNVQQMILWLTASLECVKYSFQLVAGLRPLNCRSTTYYWRCRVGKMWGTPSLDTLSEDEVLWMEVKGRGTNLHFTHTCISFHRRTP